MAENDKLATNTKDLFKPRKFGLAAARQEAAKIMQTIDPLKVPNRIGLIFDDSGSMASEDFDEQTQTYTGKRVIDNAKAGVNNFMAYSRPDETSVAVCPLNKETQSLSCDFSLVNVYINGLSATGGTPLYTKINSVLDLPVTRLVVFSDGDPTDDRGAAIDLRDDAAPGMRKQALDKAISMKIPIDTVFIGVNGCSGYKVMQTIAEMTGGIFVHFTSSATLASSLKYLTPGLRQLLLNADNKAKIEKGAML